MITMRSFTLALLAVAAAALAGCTDNTTGTTKTLSFTQVQGPGSLFAPFGDATETKNPPGSGFALSAPLQDSSKKTVGEINVVCIATKPSKGLFGNCYGTADVPDGQLALIAGGEAEGDLTGSIVGGTGAYKGATGIFTTKSTDAGLDDSFTFTLPQALETAGPSE